MNFKIIVLLLLIINGNCSYSYARLVYSNTPPPAKKKKKATRVHHHKKIKIWKRDKKYRSTLFFKNKHIPLREDKVLNNVYIEAVLSTIVFIAALSVMPALFIIWGTIGGMIWFNLGLLLAISWIITGNILEFRAYQEGVGGASLLVAGYFMLLFTLVSALGLLIWALIANIPLLFTTSILIGGLALLSLLAIWIRILIEEQL